MLISRQYTQYAAAALFLFFGVRMLIEAREAAVHGASDELEEVEQELIEMFEERSEESPPQRHEQYGYPMQVATAGGYYEERPAQQRPYWEQQQPQQPPGVELVEPEFPNNW